ncbi:hypothetical protein CRUP_028797 [Coryphaenoides rupestris]|nr:hypothetical protein CRUP_028797 [Coryphaenoides rupestris]
MSERTNRSRRTSKVNRRGKKKNHIENMTTILELQELRKRTASGLLAAAVPGPQVKAGVQAMARLPLALSVKYRSIDAEAIVKGNTAGGSREQVVERMGRLVKALNILEKYGFNLTNPNRPRYWRSVKHNNPTFKATVDTMQGGRGILFLYGYTTQQVDGLSFPDDITQPDRDKVAAVTLEIMCLRSEVEMLIKGTHLHPELFQDVNPLVVRQQVQQEKKEEMVVSPGEVNIAKGTSTKAPPPTLTKAPPPTLTKTPPTNLTTTPPTTDTPTMTPPPTPTPTKTPAPAITETPPTTLNMSSTSPTSNPTTLICPPTMTSPMSLTSPTTTVKVPPQPKPRLRSLPAQAATLSPSPSNGCTVCGAVPMVICLSCSPMVFCETCDGLYHRNPARSNHKREPIKTANEEPCTICGISSADVDCSVCVTRLCRNCDKISLLSLWTCSHCSVKNLGRAVLCVKCERPQWECQTCPMVNQGCSVLCAACERPRLASRASINILNPNPKPSLPSTTPPGTDTPTEWTCQYCTYMNPAASSKCQMCASPSGGGGAALPLPRFPDQSPAKHPATQTLKPDALLDQNRLVIREDSLWLIKHIKEAEKKGVSPEEVCAAVVSCGNSSNTNPCDWLSLELPHLLDEICAMATSSIQYDNYNAGDSGTAGAAEAHGGAAGQRSPKAAVGVGGAELQLSRAEAKRAWLAAGGHVQQAVKRLLGARRANRPLLEPFQQRINTNQPEAPIDAKHPDKQRMCRRLLAFYDLPSWGRSEMALSLLTEEGARYTLEDVVAVLESLTTCECLYCRNCFKQCFDIKVREKHVMDMTCAFCERPDLNDPEQMQNYFSLLDTQLREILDRDVYDIFTKKLTEYSLMKDPKFLWCCFCSEGFINERNQRKVNCVGCKKSLCGECKKPWETQHEDLSCELFLQWKRDNDPDWQKQGLAGFLQDNGIICPNCHFQYVLAKGGCMHFTCRQCKYQFCSGCNNLVHKKNGVAFNTDPPNGTENDGCSLMQQKEDGTQFVDEKCGAETKPKQAGLCEKHYIEYLVSLINDSSLDPAALYNTKELEVAGERYHLDVTREENEADDVYNARLLAKLQGVQLGDKVPRRK